MPVCAYRSYCNFVHFIGLRFHETFDLDSTPEFVIDIILTYLIENFDNIKDMVG